MDQDKDEFHGVGGSYIVDKPGGKRRLVERTKTPDDPEHSDNVKRRQAEEAAAAKKPKGA